MIDAKFALKYDMPHTVLHIVDNSSYAGELPVIIADDPSLYATIVVTGGLPMGEDNTVVNITRGDVLNVGFGVQNLTKADREKYGQCVDYPSTLIAQGAPVRLMRVTPEGSTYAVSCIVCQWRIDPIDNKVHVRFKNLGIPSELQLSRFKNTNKLNEALVKAYKNDTVVDGGYTWKQRVFITNISAGRGKVYNNMTTAINTSVQSKNPANVKYDFATIDTRTNQTVERFSASLVNIDNNMRTDYVETANILVGKRVEGSSIVIPYVNESAVTELYRAYITHFDSMMNSTTPTDFVNKVYASLNVNTFDMIYGQYIYNGSDVAVDLPYYQVEMYDTDVVKLPESQRVAVSASEYTADPIQALYSTLTPTCYGVSRNGDNVYVGDVYLTTSGTSAINPTLNIVAAINQYSGAVTSLNIPRVYPKNAAGEIDTTKVNGVNISTIFNDSTDGTNSIIINKLVANGTLGEGSVVALVSGSTFKLYTILSVTPTATVGDKYTVSTVYTNAELYKAIVWNSHSSGASGVGNLIGRSVDDPAFTRVGAMVISSTGEVYVNNYNYKYSSTAEFTVGRIAITNATSHFGTCPSDVNILTDLVGTEYDVIVYEDDSADSWKIVDSTITVGGTGYAVNDIVGIAAIEGETPGTTFKVTAVNETGAITGMTVQTQVVETIAAVAGTTALPLTSTTGTGTGATATFDTVVVSYDSIPSSVNRYVVAGVQGSIYRVAQSGITVPSNYYIDDVYGINMSSEVGGVKLAYGSTGFFDDEDMNEIEFKWRYSALLVRAYRGLIDPRIMSPNRVPAKYLFDAGHNTIVGQTILPNMTYAPVDVINASTIFTADEKEDVMFNPSLIAGITSFEDVDVKQAMYDFMIYRCYQGMPEAMRPIGPGAGLSLLLDSGVTDANTAQLMETSFQTRFNNPNASWDIGGWVDVDDGLSYTYAKWVVMNLVSHCKTYTVNKPFTGKYATIPKERYISYFPDIDTTDWDLRQLLYKSGGNVWIPDISGSLYRRSQRTLYRDSETSDLIQESNMRTLSQFTYLLQNKLDSYLLEYDDNNDGTLKTLSDEVNNMFSNWVGTCMQALNITFERDKNTDGNDILVCYADVTFRGLILRIPIITNVNRRD